MVDFGRLRYTFKILRSHLTLLVNKHRFGTIGYCQYVPKRLFSVQTSALRRTAKMQQFVNSFSKTNALDSLMENHVGKSELTDEEWSKLKEDLTLEFRMDPIAFETLIMKHFTAKRSYHLGRSFLQFIKKNGRPNLMTISHYIDLCGACIDHSSEEEILSALNEIPSDALINSAIANCVVRALVQTSQWTRSLDIVKSSNSQWGIIDIVAAAAFRNGNFETAWKLLDELLESEVMPTTRVHAFEDCVAAASRMSSLQDVKKLLTRMLIFCRNNHILISDSCARKLKDVLKSRFSMNGNIIITRTNVCASCGTCLEQNGLNSLEMLRLQDDFKSKVVIGSNIFLQSTPDEVNRFLKFIENCKPYDIVIDGLNAAYNKYNKASNSQLTIQLRDVVRHFRETDLNRIVMIGRKHMQRIWPRQVMNEIEKMATCFYAEDISKDDPFILYAALFSGPETYFLSNDTFKDHRFKLDDDVKGLFSRWKSSRQILFPTKRSGRPYFQLPLKHGIRVQGSFERGWHIPVHFSDDVSGPYDYCKHWLCVNHK